MKRCRFLTRVAAVVTMTALSRAAQAQVPTGAEPTYTVTFPDKATLKLQAKVAPTAGGGQTIVVQSRPRTVAPTPLWLDSALTIDKTGAAQSCRAEFGPVPHLGVLLQADRLPGGGAYQIGIPEVRGTAPFSGPLTAPLLAELFVGRMVDWKKSGPQNFVWVVDLAALNEVRLANLTLTIVNNGKTETLTLPDGDVPARKLHATLLLPFLPENAGQKTEADFWVGPSGEVVKCDSAFFGLPFTAKGKAFYENSGSRLALYFGTSASVPALPRIVLRADKQQAGASAGWNIGLDIGEARSPFTLARLASDTNYRLTLMETPWRGRTTRVNVVGNEVRWSIDADKGQVVLNPSGQTWWMPSWFVTSTWEGPGMPFAGMEPGSGEKRTGDYFILFTGQRDANPFTLERLADTSASVGGRDLTVRHYRFVSKNVYDVYTDGARLIAFVGSDKTTLTRDGWETWAKPLPFPAPPSPEK